MSRADFMKVVAVSGTARIVAHELPPLSDGHVRVRTRFSGISAGTEMLALSNSLQHPDQEHAIGYQLAGEVEAAAGDVDARLKPGDRVACYGGPYVHHAAVVNVPKHLCVRLPDQVSLEHAAFCGLGTIALHAFRRGELTLGETAAVVGLGPLGNVTAQIVRAAGCRTVAVDFLEHRRELAARCGVPTVSDWDELARRIRALSSGHGADAVFIVVAGANDKLVQDAVELVRERGRVVIVGTASARIPREALFSNEATITVSRAGGPGRYDKDYEAGGYDYPYAYARWTEGRNLEEAVRLMAERKLRVGALITDIVPVEEAPATYRMLQENPADHVGVVFRWP